MHTALALWMSNSTGFKPNKTRQDKWTTKAMLLISVISNILELQCLAHSSTHLPKPEMLLAKHSFELLSNGIAHEHPQLHKTG
jgi:hypothetical protein